VRKIDNFFKNESPFLPKFSSSDFLPQFDAGGRFRYGLPNMKFKKRSYRKNSRRDAGLGGSEEQETTLSRNLTRTLAGLLIVSLSVWAVLASLIAWHSHNRFKWSRVDLQDQKDIYNEYKAEVQTDLTFLRKELTESEILREQITKLIQQFVEEESQPAKLNDLLDSVIKVYALLTRETLDQQDVAYMEDLVRDLITRHDAGTKKPVKPVPPQQPSFDVNGMLAILAEQGLLEGDDLEKIAAQLKKILDMETKTQQPAPPPRIEKKEQVVEVVQETPLAPPEKPEGPQPQPYKNDLTKFSAIFPAEWDVKKGEVDTGVMAVSPRSGPRLQDAGFVIINATELRTPQSLESFFESNTNETAQVSSGYELLIAGDMDIDKSTAKYARYKHDKIGKKFETLKIVTMRDKFVYVMTFSALDQSYEPKYERNFARIALSFKFL
jgi:hypothetical protein